MWEYKKTHTHTLQKNSFSQLLRPQKFDLVPILDKSLQNRL